MSTVTLPSGLTVELRALTGKDGGIISNPQFARDNMTEDYLLQNCIVGVVDEGPYDFKNKAPDWNKVLVGDRFSALINLRETTYPGKEYVAKVECGRAMCQKKSEYDISLAELLSEKTQKLDPKDQEMFRQGNKFPGVFPGTDQKFTFRLLTGQDQKRIQATINQKKTGPKSKLERQNAFIDSIVGRIVEIDGLPKKPDVIFDFLEALPLPTLDETLPYLQSHDCGVDTVIELTCVHCGGAIEVSLPFDAAFFLPKTATTKMRTKSNATPEAEDGNEPQT